MLRLYRQETFERKSHLILARKTSLSFLVFCGIVNFLQAKIELTELIHKWLNPLVTEGGRHTPCDVVKEGKGVPVHAAKVYGEVEF